MNIFDKPKGDGLQDYLKMRQRMKLEARKRAADGYEKIPDNIRAALAKVAGVPNKRLDELTAPERRKLNQESKKLLIKIIDARVFIASADTYNSVSGD